MIIGLCLVSSSFPLIIVVIDATAFFCFFLFFFLEFIEASACFPFGFYIFS